METTGRLDRGDGVELAWAKTEGRGPTVVFLPGYGSDMTGDKATALAAFADERGIAMLRLDYSGHGDSGGDFLEGTIGIWAADAGAVIDRLTTGPLILVGSSMGGWIALLTALARPGRVAALVGIAGAPDFTQRLMLDRLTDAQRTALMRDGVIYRDSQYGPPTPLTRKLIEDGPRNFVLTGSIPLSCPVRLLHGQRDPDVPWQLSLQVAEQLQSDDVQVILVKDGDHRLSRPQDLALLRRTVAALLGQDGA
ncbi:MAG: alpha/beta fold hydrolase [Acetobacteraceae bacterium]